MLLSSMAPNWPRANRSVMIMFIIIITLHIQASSLSAYNINRSDNYEATTQTSSPTTEDLSTIVSTQFSPQISTADSSINDINDGLRRFNVSINSANNHGIYNLSQLTKENKEFGEQMSAPQINRIIAAAGKQQQPARKLIRSRYRLKMATSGQQQNEHQLANYSQPFDMPPTNGNGNANLQPVLGRALTGGTPGFLDHLPPSSSSYAYMPAIGEPTTQRVSQQSPVGSATSVGQGEGGGQGNGGLFLDEPSAYNQESLLDYTNSPVRSYGTAGGVGRMQYGKGMPFGRSRGGMLSGEQMPYLMASPSMNSFGISDYYGSGSVLDPQNSLEDTYESGRSMANFSEPSPSISASSYGTSGSSLPYYGSLSGSSYPFEFGHVGYSSPQSGSSFRDRWSWPWTDVGSHFGHNHHSSGSSIMNPMTAATFKKHIHHHHMPKEHHHGKEHEHHHHEEHDHMMSKWEHGISIGEIACIAIAVVLGIIILGSPFFLLFLMLFNGGNLFGATQMGLLAPAGAAATTAPAGKRRRKRSIEGDEIISRLASTFSASEMKKLKDLDVKSVGEFLFKRLSPYMNAERLIKSFERIMDVKDDIDRVVGNLRATDKNVWSSVAAKLVDEGEPASSQQSALGNNNQPRDEMRRRRRK